MDTTKTGGPAYPSANDVRIGDLGTSGHPGKTLLDDFAGMAMQGMMMANGRVSDATAVEAYLMAQCMITERNRLMNEKP